MMPFKSLLFVLMIVGTYQTFTMEPPKPKQAPAQQAGRRPNVWTAAQTGDLENIQYWIAQKKFDLPSNDNVTPLLMAVSASPEKASDQQYFAVVKALVDAGADVTKRDKQGFTVLHKVVHRAGDNLPTLKYLLAHGANKLVNTPGGPENRTPLGEALRAHQGSLIWLEIAQKDLNEAEFVKALPEALKELDQKIMRRPNTTRIRDIITELVKAGANPGILDKQGHPLSYHIDRFIFLNEPARKELLAALGQKYTPKEIIFPLLNLADRIKELNELAAQNPIIAGKLRMARWAMESAAKDANAELAFKKLRVALALLAKANFDSKSDATALVQIAVHDAAEQLKNRAERPAAAQVPPVPQPPAAVLVHATEAETPAEPVTSTAEEEVLEAK